MKLFAVYFVLVLLLHVVPLGKGGVKRFDVGQVRADYVLHTVVFLPWMLFAFFHPGRNAVFNMANEPARSRRRLDLREIRPGGSIVWFGLGVLTAAVAEGLQYWLPGRSFNPMDVLFNVLGVGAGAVLWGALAHGCRLRRRASSTLMKRNSR